MCHPGHPVGHSGWRCVRVQKVYHLIVVYPTILRLVFFSIVHPLELLLSSIQAHKANPESVADGLRRRPSGICRGNRGTYLTPSQYDPYPLSLKKSHLPNSVAHLKVPKGTVYSHCPIAHGKGSPFYRPLQKHLRPTSPKILLPRRLRNSEIIPVAGKKRRCS